MQNAPSHKNISAIEIHSTFQAIKSHISKTVRGKDEIIDSVLICLLANGHALLEDLPGMGKTTIAYALASSLDTSFSRIQFTSDLLPTDVLGVSVYDEHEKKFVLKKGPLFTNILLADEINRASPKTQSSLLEAMERRKVSIDGETLSLPNSFMVIATQNPIDHQSTFPLPDSQLDRFLMRLSIGYPDEAEEIEILKHSYSHYDETEKNALIDLPTLTIAQELSAKTFAENSILSYIRNLAHATREDPAFRAGISPRGAVALLRVGQASALYEGREYVTPSDIITHLPAVWSHRLRPTQPVSEQQEQGLIQNKLEQLIQSVPRPA